MSVPTDPTHIQALVGVIVWSVGAHLGAGAGGGGGGGSTGSVTGSLAVRRAAIGSLASACRAARAVSPSVGMGGDGGGGDRGGAGDSRGENIGDEAR